MQGLSSLTSTIEFLVYEINEQVDINLGAIEHLHDGHTLILKLEQVL